MKCAPRHPWTAALLFHTHVPERLWCTGLSLCVCMFVCVCFVLSCLLPARTRARATTLNPTPKTQNPIPQTQNPKPQTLKTLHARGRAPHTAAMDDEAHEHAPPVGCTNSRSCARASTHVVCQTRHLPRAAYARAHCLCFLRAVAVCQR